VNNPYTVLGIANTATEAEKKKAYKSLSMKYHPDRETGNEQKFKEINEAYSAIKGKQYNESTAHTFRSASQFNDFFNQHRQQHINITVNITVKMAATGGRQVVQLQTNGQAKPVLLQIEIPKGVIVHERIKYPNLLNAQTDIYVTFQIASDNTWTIEGLDLLRKHRLTFWDLILGVVIDVETITGTKLQIKVPPNTPPNTRFRIPKHGMQSRQNYLLHGDMFVDIIGTVPTNISKDLLSLIRENNTK